MAAPTAAPTARREAPATARSVLLASPGAEPDLGEVAHYVWQLARSLRSRHGRHVVIATRTAGAAGRYETPDGVPVYCLGAPLAAPPVLRERHWRRALREVAEAERVELVNAHTRASAPLFADTVARACAGLPFVLTYHPGPAPAAEGVPGLLRVWYERRARTRAVRRAREVVCTSDSVAAGLPGPFADRSTRIVPGVDPDACVAGQVPEAPRVVFPGLLAGADAGQELSDLLRALGVLSRTVPQVRLEVLHRGEVRDGYEGLARRLGLDGRVTFTRLGAAEEPADACRRGRVLVLPAHDVRSPGALAEALTWGRPVVTPAAGSAPSLISSGDTGLLVAPGDVPGLAEALGSVLHDDVLARRLAAAGRARAVRELSWERQSDRTAEVFDRAVDPGRRTPTVAVVAPNYFPKIGGVENYARRVAHAVAADPAMRAVVITAQPTRRRTSVGTDGDVPVVRLGTWARHLNTPVNPLWLWQLGHWLRRLDVDLVDAHAPVPGLGDLAIAVSGHRPTVFTYHAGTMVQGHWDVDLLVNAYERYVLPRVFARARAVVASSPVSLAAGRPGAVVITPGVDVDRFTPGPPASTRSRTLVYVGRLDRASPWKGVDVLLRAFAALADLPGVRLRLVGEGDAVPEHVAHAERLGIADRVEFTGPLVADALVAAVQSAAVLVLPSQTAHESFGMVLVEAMACGTPVVGSDVGGIPYVVTPGVTGLLFPHDSTEALAGACRRLLLDGRLADRMGAAGRRCAVERYAWPALTERHLRLFRSLLPAPPAPSTRTPRHTAPRRFPAAPGQQEP
ncbi:glycosyltransferase family 4 protein [Streptomyces sp. NPDC028635]|uniref:glycosyltransferase family 4 protein n=1 Tax=Streptomyces sp. NPDC028635 TaxID=3154800 RepID=UPI0033EA2978